MKRIIMATGFALALVLGGMSGQARAEAKQDFTLINKTGYQIKEVYVSPNNSDDWQDDVLGKNLLDNGRLVEIKFHRATTGCKWDLKVVYSDDDSSAVWHGLDMCEISKVTIKYNRNTDTTSASVE
ncbi:MAG: argininosuccinate lyase [Rhodospirillaceae bacterium]